MKEARYHRSRDVDERHSRDNAQAAYETALWTSRAAQQSFPADVADTVVRAVVAYNGNRSYPYNLQQKILARRVRSALGRKVPATEVAAAASACGLKFSLIYGFPGWYITPDLISEFRDRLNAQDDPEARP